MSTTSLPPPNPSQKYVTIHALSSGFLTLPEHMFIHPSIPGTRNTVPSLSFLLHHHNPETKKTTRLIFDLGLRKELNNYPTNLQAHLKSREPLTTSPDVKESLEKGGLSPDDIDVVMLSHVHWDHIGTPSDFKTTTFIVGNGSLDLLKSGGDPSRGSHSFYEPDLLPLERTIELPSTTTSNSASPTPNPKLLSPQEWAPLGPLPHAIDLLSDGSIYIVSSPGHLQGHINLLARTGPKSWVYLAGDACHDRRILSKEVEIATWKNETGQVCCIHVDKEATEKTIVMIAGLEKDPEVEVILAHDVEWARSEENGKRFWPGKL